MHKKNNESRLWCLVLALAVLVSMSPTHAGLGGALTSGNPKSLPADSVIIDAALAQISLYQTSQNLMLQGIHADDAISYVPGNRSQLIRIRENESVFPLLVGNGGSALAVWGTTRKSRFAAYGSVPMEYFLQGQNLGHEPAFKRLLGWLLTGKPDTASFGTTTNIALTFTGGSHADITNWLGQQAPGWQVKVCDDAATITACYKKQDLLILSWENKDEDANADQVVLAAVKTHIKSGKPVLYLHTWYEPTSHFSDILSAELGFNLPYGGNYWANDQASFASRADMQAGQDSFADIQTLLLHFRNRDYSFDWSTCNDDRSCKNLPSLVSGFYNGAEDVRQQVAKWEADNLDIFRQPGRKLGKLLVLLGDKFRSGIHYPMTKGITNDTSFLQALYADHATYITRRFNPAQPDLGNFSDRLPRKLHKEKVTLTQTSKSSSVSSTSGYYAPPGKSIVLTRTDTATVKAYAHINMLRSGAAHVFSTYNRPMFLWSTTVPLETGKPVKITSPYGGIVFLKTEGSTTPQTVQVSAKKVLRQAIFTGDNPAEFEAQLASSPLNWAEVKLPAIEIHSRMDLFRESINDALIGGDMMRLVSLTQTYLYDDIYSLAGMVGDGLDQTAAVTAFCSSHNWDCTSTNIHGVPNIQHINADQANCGYGCSGNPYDQYWAYSPLGWGESHEIGHNLQRSRLKIYDGASTEVSNNIFPVHKWLRFNQASGEVSKFGRNLGFKATFDALQLAAKSPDPIDAAHQAIWVNGDVFQRLVFYWQMAMSSQDLPQLSDNGWDLFRLLYIHERLFTQAIKSDADWNNQRNSLGFSQYNNRSSATSISSNDFMLIAMSFITSRDQRPFFDMWGITYSTEASAQVGSFAFTPAAKNFWVVPDEDKQFQLPLASPVLVDGNGVWPL